MSDWKRDEDGGGYFFRDEEVGTFRVITHAGHELGLVHGWYVELDSRLVYPSIAEARADADAFVEKLKAFLEGFSQ